MVEWVVIRPPGGVRVTEDDEIRITEEGDTRILEDGDTFWTQVNPP
jgi:hypothetical protein